MSSQAAPANGSTGQHPLLSLKEEDLDLMLQFVLASGSLKDLARIYQVSYPTIRVRVDRMIGRLREVMTDAPSNPMTNLLMELLDRGEITVSAARMVRDLYQQAEKSSE
jgi:hypothetical protein